MAKIGATLAGNESSQAIPEASEPSRIRGFLSWLNRKRTSYPAEHRMKDLPAVIRSYGRSVKSQHRSRTQLKLTGRCLAELDLSGCDFINADLTGTDFRSAKLVDAVFDKAIVREAKFFDADLTNCDLSQSLGLRSKFLAGANLENAHLPENAREFPLLEVAREVAEKAQTTFFAVLLGCFFCWLTIAGTTDASLIANAGMAKLPVVGFEVPTAGFYLLAPTVLLAVHIYLQLYLQRLWEALAGLPAIFPDGQRLDRKAFAWLLVGAIRPEVVWLKRRPTPFGVLGTWLPKLMAWWLVPITLAVFYMRNLVAHDGGATLLQILLFSSAGVFSWRALRLMRKTLRTHGTATRSRKRVLGSIALSVCIVAVLTLALGGWTGLALASVEIRGKQRSYSGIQGALYSYSERNVTNEEESWEGWSKFAAATLSLGRNWMRVEGFGSQLSITPDNWNGELPKDFKAVKGPKLMGRDLKGARFGRAFLPKADFSGSMLDGADFQYADLRMIRVGGHYQERASWGLILDTDELKLGWSRREEFRTASVRKADFSYADLRYAEFSNVNLKGTEFLMTDLRYAGIGVLADWAPDSMIGADLRGATLTGDGWNKTLFYGARLDGADLSGIHLSTNTVAFVTYDETTMFPKSFPLPVRAEFCLSEYGAIMLATFLDKTSQTNYLTEATAFFREATRQTSYRRKLDPLARKGE